MRKPTVVGRAARVAAVAIAVIVVAVILLSGAASYQVRLVFGDASQIVKGDQVDVAGSAVGPASAIALDAEWAGSADDQHLGLRLRAADNRGNTYPGPTRPANPENLTKGNFPSWDCNNTGAGGDGSVPTNNIPPVCPGRRRRAGSPRALPGAKAGQIPHLLAAQYPDK